MNKRGVKKVLKFLKNNYGWVIALITSSGVLVLNIIKFIEYIKCNLYFAYYGIDVNLYKYGDKNVIYELFLSILILFATISVLYCCYELENNIKKKRIFNFSNLINLIIISLYNIIAITTNINNLTIEIFFIELLILIILENIFAYSIFGKLNIKHISKKQKKEFAINYFKVLPYMIILILFLLASLIIIPIRFRRNYRIIDDNKVIVYTNSEYSIILDCEINDDNLIIYKGRQEKIDNTNIYSVYIKFELVEIR